MGLRTLHLHRVVPPGVTSTTHLDVMAPGKPSPSRFCRGRLFCWRGGLLVVWRCKPVTKKQIQNLVIRLALTAICLKFPYLLLIPALWFIWFARDGQGIWINRKTKALPFDEDVLSQG